MCWVRLRFPEQRGYVLPAAWLQECVKQASVTSFDAMQPSGCRGVQAGRQAEAGCSCALRWHLRPPGFARSRGGAASCKAPEAISMLWCCDRRVRVCPIHNVPVAFAPACAHLIPFFKYPNPLDCDCRKPSRLPVLRLVGSSTRTAHSTPAITYQ
eukprot:scaffold15244_cov137-Isochrysis_galbana.AAC.3